MNLKKTKYEPDCDQIYLSMYQKNILSKKAWLDKANALFDVADIIEQKVIEFWDSWRSHLKDRSTQIKSDKYISVYLMLVAYGIENLLKAIIVEEERDNIKRDLSNGKLPKILDSHNLVKLCQSAGFQITDELQEELLRRLSRGAVWYGRYPIPVYYRNGKNEIFLNNKKNSICLDRENDVDMIKNLLGILKNFANVRND